MAAHLEVLDGGHGALPPALSELAEAKLLRTAAALTPERRMLPRPLEPRGVGAYRRKVFSEAVLKTIVECKSRLSVS